MSSSPRETIPKEIVRMDQAERDGAHRFLINKKRHEKRGKAILTIYTTKACTRFIEAMIMTAFYRAGVVSPVMINEHRNQHVFSITILVILSQIVRFLSHYLLFSNTFSDMIVTILIVIQILVNVIFAFLAFPDMWIERYTLVITMLIVRLLSKWLFVSNPSLSVSEDIHMPTGELGAKIRDSWSKWKTMRRLKHNGLYALLILIVAIPVLSLAHGTRIDLSYTFLHKLSTTSIVILAFVTYQEHIQIVVKTAEMDGYIHKIKLEQSWLFLVAESVFVPYILNYGPGSYYWPYSKEEIFGELKSKRATQSREIVGLMSVASSRPREEPLEPDTSKWKIVFGWVKKIFGWVKKVFLTWVIISFQQIIMCWCVFTDAGCLIWFILYSPLAF